MSLLLFPFFSSRFTQMSPSEREEEITQNKTTPSGQHTHTVNHFVDIVIHHSEKKSEKRLKCFQDGRSTDPSAGGLGTIQTRPPLVARRGPTPLVGVDLGEETSSPYHRRRVHWLRRAASSHPPFPRPLRHNISQCPPTNKAMTHPPLWEGLRLPPLGPQGTFSSIALEELPPPHWVRRKAVRVQQPQHTTLREAPLTYFAAPPHLTPLLPPPIQVARRGMASNPTTRLQQQHPPTTPP